METRNVYKIWLGNLIGRDHSGDVDVDGKSRVTLILINRM